MLGLAQPDQNHENGGWAFPTIFKRDLVNQNRAPAIVAKYPLVVLGLAVAFLLGGCGQEPAGSTAPSPAPEKVLRIVKDRKGRHTARVVQQGAKQLVLRDGEPGPEYDRIGAVAFSADGRTLAYEALKGKQKVVVLDEQEWPLDAEVVQGSLTMSPDSKRLALVACAKDKCQVMVDGRPDPPFDYVFPDTLRFSSDSRHTGYLAFKGKRLQVVVDGRVRDRLDILTEGNKALTEYLYQAAGTEAVKHDSEEKP